MKPGALVALLVAAALAVANAQAQSGAYPNFPYCACVKTPSPYSLVNTVKAMGGGKYCFTLNVKQPSSSAYCASADLKKIEFNIQKSCDIGGVSLKATVNGVATTTAPVFDIPQEGPVNSTILKLTNLGLGLGSDGTEVCVTLGTNSKGAGCTTLEQLCIPPAGYPAGVCSVAMFDSNTKCCPISTPGVPSPPPPSPPPPPPPSPPPPPPPSPPPPSPPPPSPPPPSPPPPSPPPPSPPPPSPPPPSPPPPSPPPPSPPPPSPPPPPPPSPPPPPPPSPPPPPPPSPPPPSPPPPSPPPPPPPSPPPPPPPSPPPPPPPSPPPPPPPSPPPPSPPPPSPPPPSPPPPSPPPPSPPPPSPPPPPPPSPPPPPPPSPPPPPPPSPPPPSPPPPSPPPPSPPPPSPPPPPPPSPPPPPPPSPPPPPPPSPPPPSPPPPSPPPPSPPPPSPPPPPPPSPPPPSPPPPSPPPPSPPPPSPPPPPPPSPPPPPPPSPPPPSPPPPSPPPPSPPPPSPPPPCQTCFYVTLTPTSPLFPLAFNSTQCNTIANKIVLDINQAASSLGAKMLVAPSLSSCTAQVVKVCGVFFSDADGAKLQSFVDTQMAFWLELVFGAGGDCKPSFNGYTVGVAVGGDGNPAAPPTSCLSGSVSKACAPQPVDFPKCQCNTKPLATPFAAQPVMSTLPGRNGSTLYCFTLAKVTPTAGKCAGKTTLLKAEIFADDAKRRKVTGIAVQAAGAASLSFRSTTWGAMGEQTLKATPLNWNLAKASGAKVCMEIAAGTTLDDVCLGPAGTCWINFFDDAKDCCPLYSAAL